ncbi:hypothetical protein [Granulicella sp. dw_53]|uniref:hypothetical protein n=1 Tax=Granulicella sp. dw_53 TaxID=2719792 RepID=UPI001BD54B17|nr:hypothetical protein [Granulicella sp. dw_53]
MIVIRDETAGFVVLTIDNNGNIAFGDGTPVTALSLASNGIIDSNGHIIHGVGSCSMNAPSGSVNCGVNQSVTVATQGGRIPTVQLDTSYPAQWIQIAYQLPGSDPDWPNSGYENSLGGRNGIPVHTANPDVGSFTAYNQNVIDAAFTNPGSQYYDPQWNTAVFSYRWL